MTGYHRVEPDPLMTIADGLTRCSCGRMIAKVSTLPVRWLHVESDTPADPPCVGILGVSLAVLVLLALVLFGAGVLLGRFTGGAL